MQKKSQPFPIVGIGASAGGINALEGFFRGMPTGSGMGFVVITHLNPDRESLLHDVLARFTPMPVTVASDGMMVDPDRVYVMPADAIISIKDGHLRISKQDRARPERKPIDIFLSSLAKDQGEYAVSIVLSGGDGDGTLGTKAVKEHGGLTLAQLPDSNGPSYPDMPRSAISTGLVDLALPASAMGPKLHEFSRSFDILEEISLMVSDTERGPALQAVQNEIYAIIRNQIGHDFSGYKTKTFLRRVRRRMQVLQLDTIQAYVETLRQEPREVNSLFCDLLINVTNFFRDAEAFETLKDLVIPKLFEGKGADEIVRVWVPGCATGEEVFSIGMLMREHMDTLTAVPRVQIFATDIDEKALSLARQGRYPEALLDSLTPERRKRFFIPDGASYVLNKEIRDLCIFSPHSVIRDPPFSRMDLVSCRNLLIYFGPEVQGQVIPIFHYSLRPGGYLFLGTSENVSQFAELFTPLEKKHRIFRSRDTGERNVRLPLLLGGLRHGSEARKTPRFRFPGITSRWVVEQQVLDRFCPPHVVVNRDGDIVHYSGKTGKYLEPPAGMPNRQLMAMARKGLRLDLSNAFREAVQKNTTVVRDNVAVDGDDSRVQMVRLTVEPVWDTTGEEPLYLVLFSDEGPALSHEDAMLSLDKRADGDIAHVERELRDSRERLQSMMEEYETALEELKSSNEELVSVNEELQSTNEELEASKEELQSVNEEMQTINAELASKVEALDQANNDLRNLFESTQVATIFLDKSLVIRSFTPAVSQIFNILPGDHGRPITDLSSKLDLSDLKTDIAAVFSDGRTQERQITVSDDNAHYLLRVIPYRSVDRIEGVVLTFVDVTSLTKAEAHQRLLIAELQHRTRNLLAVIQSIANQTLGTSGSLEAFRESFNQRLAALSRVQGLLSTSRAQPITIGTLVRMELDALNALRDGKQVVLEGPEIALPESMIRTLALVLHELATNASKHGALASEQGSLTITWGEGVGPQGEQLELNWTESGVRIPPEQRESAQHGFGRSLIERALPYQLRAKADYELTRDGVRCFMAIPLAAAPPVSGDSD